MVTAFLLACGMAMVDGPADGAGVELPGEVRVMLEAHCVDCHRGRRSKGGAELAGPMASGRVDEGVLRAVRARLARRDMPPLDEPIRPTDAEYAAAVQAIDAVVAPARREVPSVRRLNRAQWAGAIRDVLGVERVDGRPVDALLPPDDVGEGFDTTADTLALPTLAVERFVDAAEAVAQSLPAEALGRAGGEGERPARLAAAARAWGEAMFRRALTEDEVRALADRASAAVGPDAGWEPTARALATMVMVDPRFLLRVEAPAAADGRALSGDEVGSRLAIFLWSSVPDAELRVAAAAGGLDSEDGVRAQATRMLADPRAGSLARRFAVQWLAVDRLEGRFIDGTRFKGVDAALRTDMRIETERLFVRVARGEVPVRALIEARSTEVSPRLAAHYGFPVPEDAAASGAWFACSVPPERPPGVLGHAAVLLATSNPDRTSPVKRGKWVLEAMADAAPPPPPPGVPSIPDDAKGRAGRSIRELMAMHRSNPDCASCHVRMDAIGLAFERFDPVGRMRSEADGHAIDDVTELPDGRTLEGAGAVAALVGEGNAFERSLARHLATYALGRGMADADDPWLDALAVRVRTSGRFEDLVHGIVTSRAFRFRDPAP
jgi:hypothetical protein